jgi:hypothetical protein
LAVAVGQWQAPQYDRIQLAEAEWQAQAIHLSAIHFQLAEAQWQAPHQFAHFAEAQWQAQAIHQFVHFQLAEEWQAHAPHYPVHFQLAHEAQWQVQAYHWHDSEPPWQATPHVFGEPRQAQAVHQQVLLQWQAQAALAWQAKEACMFLESSTPWLPVAHLLLK